MTEEEEKLAADLSTAAVSSMSANRRTRSRRPFGPEEEEEEEEKKSTNPSAYPTDDVDPGTELVGVQKAFKRVDFKMAVSRLICVVERK